MEPYIPTSLPPQNIDWAELMPDIARANDGIARYHQALLGIVNPLILLSPMITQEAVLSSRIEGTQASLDDVLSFEADTHREVTPRMRADIEEIVNYRTAMQKAMEELRKRPLSLDLVRDLHRVLLTGVPGQDREPGEIRKTQNYITLPGHPVEEPIFVPPEPGMVIDALNDWENYLHGKETDNLVQLAILKAQFELVHPFCDGNGRIGRMLVPLILYSKGMISSPVFPISLYLERHRDEYFAALLGVSRRGDWNRWTKFFLQALSEQAEENRRKAIGIHTLYQEMETAIPGVVRSQHALQVIDALFSRPQFPLTDFIQNSGVPKESAKRLLHTLRQKGILEVVREGRGRSPAIYRFTKLILIVEGRI